MQDFLYDNYTRLLFGKDAEAQLGAQAAEFSKAKKALIVYGSDRVKKDGLLGRSEQALQDQGFETKCLGGVVPNPRLSKVHEGIQMAREMGADFILGVGGGSVMDTAKAIAAGVPYEGDVWDFAIGKAELATALPVGVVATMAATGSESSEWAVITNDEDMSKLGIGGGCLRPAFAVLNPELTMTQPAYQTACGCVDIMAHVMDSFFTRTPDCVLTDNMSIALLKTVVEFAPIALKEPNNYHARAELMLTSTLAMSGLVAPVIQTVRAWMKRVLTLLLDNAGKFTEKGVIRLQCEEDKENNIIRFIIEDTGIGIEPQYQETVFERFFKVDSFTPGTGLGLSIARQVMDIVDGKIYLDTSYNSGVRVVVEWPMN